MPVAPLLAVAAVASVGLSAYGTYEQQRAASRSAEYQKNILAQEQAQEAARRKAAELQNRRSQMEMLRNQQRARAMALANATAQSASQGSGLQGGYGQISGEAGNNLLGLDQNFSLGTDIYNSNQIISQNRIGLAGAQSMAAQGQGFSSLGGSILSAATSFNSIGQGFGGYGGSSYGGNSYSTYGGTVRSLGRGGIY